VSGFPSDLEAPRGSRRASPEVPSLPLTVGPGCRPRGARTGAPKGLTHLGRRPAAPPPAAGKTKAREGARPGLRPPSPAAARTAATRAPRSAALARAAMSLW
jgi:hypothetical protein